MYFARVKLLQASDKIGLGLSIVFLMFKATEMQKCQMAM